MRIALLQEERYLPHFHGSNKSNRALLQALARERHQCMALCPVLLKSASPESFRAEMKARGIEVRENSAGMFWYRDGDVEVHGLPRFASSEDRAVFIREHL